MRMGATLTLMRTFRSLDLFAWLLYICAHQHHRSCFIITRMPTVTVTIVCIYKRRFGAEHWDCDKDNDTSV